MKTLITAMLIVGASQTSVAGVYDITLRRVSISTDLGSCQGFAEETARELTTQTGARVIDAGCKYDSYTFNGLDAVITYESPNRLLVTTTSTAGRTFSAAFFANKAECIEQLERQKELFTNATGLTPLAAYCMLDVTHSALWSTRVDAIGQSDMKPEAAAITLWGTIANKEEVFANFDAAAGAYDLLMHESGISSDGLSQQLVIRFYATTPHNFEVYNDMKFQTMETCYLSAEKVDTILKTAAKPVVSFCVRDGGSSSYTLFVAALVKTLEPTSVFSSRALPTTYSSLAPCETAVANIPNDDGTIFGAVCAGSRNSYQVHLFSRP